jgi:hypothetical protein
MRSLIHVDSSDSHVDLRISCKDALEKARANWGYGGAPEFLDFVEVASDGILVPDWDHYAALTTIHHAGAVLSRDRRLVVRHERVRRILYEEVDSRTARSLWVAATPRQLRRTPLLIPAGGEKLPRWSRLPQRFRDKVKQSLALDICTCVFCGRHGPFRDVLDDYLGGATTSLDERIMGGHRILMAAVLAGHTPVKGRLPMESIDWMLRTDSTQSLTGRWGASLLAGAVFSFSLNNADPNPDSVEASTHLDELRWYLNLGCPADDRGSMASEFNQTAAVEMARKLDSQAVHERKMGYSERTGSTHWAKVIELLSAGQP